MTLHRKAFWISSMLTLLVTNVRVSSQNIESYLSKIRIQIKLDEKPWIAKHSKTV